MPHELAPLQIRPAVEDDIAAIAALDQAAFPDAWGLDYFRQERLRDDRWLATAHRGDGPVLGFADCWIVYDEVQLQRIAVAEEGRRQGVGAALLADLLAVATARGLQLITLEVACDNAAAIALYRRFGFIEVGRRPRYYHGEIDALLLDRAINPEDRRCPRPDGDGSDACP